MRRWPSARYAILIVPAILAAAVIIIIFGFPYRRLPPEPVSESVPPSSEFPGQRHSSHLFDSGFFVQAEERANAYKNVHHPIVYGGIIPHHLLAAPLISGFFDGIAGQNVRRVILLSPNHYGAGHASISTSTGIWTTVFGDLETDSAAIAVLESSHAAMVNEDIFDTEHGIYGIVPFIRKTFPGARFVPIVIKSGTPKTDCDRLVTALARIVDAQTLILASSDFSHYLPLAQAQQHDRDSIDAVSSFRVDDVFAIDSVKNIDSPGSVYVLLKLMQEENATHPLLIANSDSAILLGDTGFPSTTSYLTMYFTR